MIKNIILFNIIFFNFSSYAIEVAIVGDSISSINSAIIPYEKCYPYLLEKELKKLGHEIDLVNVSVGGTNTYGAIDILTYLFTYHHPDIVVLEFGFNDVVRNIPILVTKDNFSKMISICSSHGCKVLVGKIDLVCWYPTLTLDYINKFNSIFIDLEKKYPGILFNFLDTEMLTSSSYNLGDKCHPNAKGHKKICDELKKCLIPLIN